MTSPRRRKLTRSTGERHYRKLFLIATEGAVTEPGYFALFNQQGTTIIQVKFIQVKCIKGRDESSPPQVLKRMKEQLKEAGLRKDDEAWLVVDKDTWSDDCLQQLHQWAREHGQRGLALSNPSFEYWLLLHMEEGHAIGSARECHERLKRHIPHYDKKIAPSMFPGGIHTAARKAIQRAKSKDSPPTPDWPRDTGTTVYKLVESILNAMAST